MALFTLLNLILAATLILRHSPRWAAWVLAVGIGVNPYLLLTLSFVLMAAGAIGLAMEWLRR